MTTNNLYVTSRDHLPRFQDARQGCDQDAAHRRREHDAQQVPWMSIHISYGILVMAY